MILILPTADIVREYRDFERLFCFYRNGLKGVIEDIVLFSSPEEEAATKYILEKIVAEYSHTPESILSKMMEKDTDTYVELITVALDDSINDMMRTLFPKIKYIIAHMECRWYCDDLIIKVRKL